MVERDILQNALSSLLDRLNDDEPHRSSEAPSRPSMRQIRAEVLRDLRALFNTRQPFLENLVLGGSLRESLISYGLPDLTLLNPHDADDLEWLARTMELTVKRFEPRLQRVRVEVGEVDRMTGKLHFRLTALLRLQPRPIPILFDTVLESETTEFNLRDVG